LTGERQEHVVEGWATQGQVRDLKSLGSQPRRHLGQNGRTVIDCQNDSSQFRIDSRSPGAEPAECCCQQGRIIARIRLQFEAVAADTPLQFSWSTGRDDPARIHHHDSVSQPIGLFEVLRGQQQAGALVLQFAE
jgi:hypothetical protein